MSGLPNDIDVAEMRRQLVTISLATKRAADLAAGIEKMQAELEGQNESYRVAREKVLELLGKMDCRSSGNFGYEGRVVAFLTMLMETQ